MDLPLVSTLEEVFAQPEDVVVTLLLDSSGSVAGDYEELRKIALTLIEKLKGMMIQVVHFATTVETVCPFTTDTKVLTSTVRGMRHLNGSTNMYDAFMHVHDSLMRIVVDDMKPIVFLITDGEPTGKHPRDAIHKLLSLKPKPQVLGVGIGSGVSVDRLSNLLPGQRVFHLTNYTGLNTTLKSFTQKAELQPAIRIEFRPVTQALQTSKSDLTLSFDAEPDEPLSRLPAGTVIKFISNAFFFGETVELDTEARRNHPATGQVTLKVKPAARHFGQFPERIIFEAQIPGSPRGKYRGSVSMLMGWLAGDFIYEREPRRPINILVWGGMGCGKSSFINGVLNLFRGMQNIKKELIAFRSQEHVTRTYSRNAVADYLQDDIPVEAINKENLQLVLWDTWGMSGSNYRTLKVNHFIEGRIYPDTVMHDSEDQTSNQPVDDYVIDAVIMLIPIGTAHMPSKMEELKSHITTVLRKNIRPVIVVNFLNTVSSEEEIEQDFQEIYKASQLSTTDLFRLDNYDNEEYRNMAKDLQYWRILQKAFSEAKKNIEARSRRTSSSPGGGARPAMPMPHHQGARPSPVDGADPHVPAWMGTPTRPPPAAAPPQNLSNRRSVPFNQPPARVDSPQPDKPSGSATDLINVTVVVSGRSSPVRANTRQTVRDIVEDALESLRLPVEDASCYQVFDASGSFVSMRKSVGDMLKDGDLLHLTREA